MLRKLLIMWLKPVVITALPGINTIFERKDMKKMASMA